MSRLSGLNSKGVLFSPCQAGQTQPKQLLIALTGCYQHSMVGKGKATLSTQANPLHVTSGYLTLAAYLTWSVEILVTYASLHQLYIVHFAALYSFENVPSQTEYTLRLTDFWVKYLQTCRLALAGLPVGLSTSDNGNNDQNNKNNNTILAQNVRCLLFHV